MNKSFRAFLDNIKFDKAEIWEDSIVDKVLVDSQNKIWKIHLITPRLMSSTLINSTTKYISEKNSYLEVVELVQVPVDAKKSIKAILDSRKDELSSYLFSDNNSLVIDELEWTVSNNKVDILINNKKIYDEILEKNIASSVYQWFWNEYKYQVIVRVILNSSVDNVPTVPSVIKTKSKLNVIEEDKNKTTNENKKKSFRKNKKLEVEVIQDEITPVSELVEGLRSVAVKGEIWKKDINILKDNRLVVSYYLTDYNDTIVVKQFYDRAEDDLINKGDWIKVKGSIRYDTFLKEIVLYMDIFAREKKPIRMDNESNKRIELHAHTKMSLMDGLTPIDELINRAEEWGHSAIAITDHGCTQAFPDAYDAAKNSNLKVIYGVEGYLIEEDKKERPYHIILLVKNQTGLENLYKLISLSYVDHYHRFPKMPRGLIEKYREGLIIGSACDSGELYSAILNQANDEELINIASFYDYLEVQPISNIDFLLRKGTVNTTEDLQNIIKKIINLGDQLDKLVVATGDVHYLDPEDSILREIIQAGQGYDDAWQQAPLYFKTTKEMLDDFNFINIENAKKIVIENPRKVSEQIENVQPVPDGFYPPKIDTAEEEIINLTYGKAKEIYSDNIPDIIQKRIERELYAITTHGFSVLYLISHKLVKKSNDDGYLVGSRGSVGSSIVAYLTGITEVNPLPPHYICISCNYSEFILDGSVGCGSDLKDKICPQCNNELGKDGFDIPFETFLGFEGDKVPDIDLNFSGDYQSKAHQYVEELFGKENVFRAGTISTIADKTAYGFVKKHFEEKQKDIKNSEASRLTKGITGVRRTTGQHPGGLIVVPKNKNIYEFTPIQHPADKKESGIITTHFEYHAIDNQLVKLDILGHDDPTVIKELEDLTGVNASKISLSEQKTMKIFSGVEPLGVSAEDIDSKVGTYGIPEFGTKFVRQMLEQTKPTTFAELVKISGLSHGTDVWLNNAQDLVKNEVASLNEVICTRDDIMTYLIFKGMDKKLAFKIMENVRKGKGLKPDEIELMKKCDIPDWYINSCQKIKYMFPKAHAVAYVTMAYRIAYFKVYYPLEFYASFFSIRAEDFDSEVILAGYDAIKRKIKEIENLGYQASQKDKKLVTILELAMEMYARGLYFYPVNLYKSDAKKFIVKDKGLILPFSSLPNVGLAAADGICEAREQEKFISIEDFQVKTRLNKTAMDVLRKNNCFEDLPETTQISLFG
ncbi:DNA polymerase III polC-type [Candidatus Syntrophocurvum alkaliphilum]|uniref:DNA polymerase III PolC-type n=1 Tax=Candidatus Syntrophocurvum alkaliphilum TaxID=2293317 RepID=A0A6I6DFI3_9FIRM|nr:PolC-type DNA polymerase III [Candidatus Syntrophocurvum alkaliphilum]QGT99208.1 DNA polymerase III polC-type [Candidatus Syntrophocurvum alkaliphilum]